MTQPVSSGARWPHADASCSDPSPEERETLTCHETHAACSAERAHGAAPLHSAPTDSDVPASRTFCQGANTVIEGFLCGEPTVVSNACRTPHNAFDAFVCDDAKMEKLQWAILRETWSIVKTIAMSVFRGRP